MSRAVNDVSSCQTAVEEVTHLLIWRSANSSTYFQIRGYIESLRVSLSRGVDGPEGQICVRVCLPSCIHPQVFLTHSVSSDVLVLVEICWLSSFR